MLYVCSASAGSGKTFRLTKEYISLLFKDLNAYRHILAVTFTNKATEEMKDRILSNLSILATRPESSPYYADIAALKDSPFFSSSPVTPDAVARAARGIMERMLNDYSAFSVSTIDKFFQRTMRAFARELGIFGSYTVELDRKAMYDESIDALIDSLGDKENASLLKWLTSLAIDSVEKGGNWNVRDSLKTFGIAVFSEEFRLKSKAFGDRDPLSKKAVDTVIRKSREIISEYEKNIRGLASELSEVIRSCGLDYTDFKGGSRSPFIKVKSLADGSITAIPDSLMSKDGAPVDDFVTAKSPARNAIEAAFERLSMALNRLCAYQRDNIELYSTATIIMPKLYMLGVMSDIRASVASILKERNSVMLDDTNETLSEIIGDSDVPFVYEKMGVRYCNFMLDEFQDTSWLQWNNFLPLISNSQAQGEYSLIVGDVKQSIYRWRSSDWRILAEDVGRCFSDVRKENLVTNWRSRENIVSFNNSFFSWLAGSLDDSTVSEVYSDICQEMPDDRKDRSGGHVEIRFFQKGESEGDEVQSYLVSSVMNLVERGYDYSDITVLVRSNNDGDKSVRVLMEHGIPVISDDSLYLAGSRSVSYIINVLTLLATSQDDQVPDGVLQGGSLYEICESVIDTIDEAEKTADTAHLYSFMDRVNDYMASEGSDLSKFLTWWDSASPSFTIAPPEGRNAVRVMTIHKSKGLDSRAVIVPFMEMPMYMPSVRWVEVDKDDFGEDILVPVALNDDAEISRFSEEYRNERLMSYIDNINVAYVAFTRSIDELIVICKPLTKKFLEGKSAPSRISEYLYAYCSGRTSGMNASDGMTFSMGDACVPDKAAGHAGPQNVVSGYRRNPVSDRLKLALDSADFFGGDDPRSRGTVLHDIMSRISYPEDLDESIRTAVEEGMASEEESVRYRTLISDAIDSVSGTGWFSKEYEVLNEAEIVEPGGGVSRPDRVLVKDGEAVVVDYKFGDREHSHAVQVRRYMRLLERMGYGPVRGYLWYVQAGEIVECSIPLS